MTAPRHALLAAVALFAGLATAPFAAHAQSTLKPGLWEYAATVKSQSGAVEKALAAAEAQIASLPPEQRRQVEEMMKARGVGVGNGTTTLRLCLGATDFEQGTIPVQAGDCAQKVVSRDSTSLKVSFTCQATPPLSGVGEVKVLSPTTTLTTSDVDTTVNGKPDRIHTTQQGKWLSDDCGNIPPLAR